MNVTRFFLSLACLAGLLLVPGISHGQDDEIDWLKLGERLEFDTLSETARDALTGLTSGDPTLIYNSTAGRFEVSTDGGSTWAAFGAGGGSAITLDLGDDGGDDSVDLAEIAITNFPTGAATEPTDDKLLFDFSDFGIATGDAWTGGHDFGGADSLEIPNGAAPTVDAAGELALDSTIADHTGLLKYHDGTEELTVIAVPTGNLTTTDTRVLSYNATANEFEFVTPGGGGGGSAITLDIGDDGGDDSTDVSEIATTGDTNSIFSESSADKLLIDLANNWPAADSADVALTGDSATSFFSSGTIEFGRLPTIDDDTMATASATNIASAESVKAYVDAQGNSVVSDTTPQLGGDLDGNGFDILFDNTTGIRTALDDEALMVNFGASPVNFLELWPAATGQPVLLLSDGSDSNVGLRLQGKGTGAVEVNDVLWIDAQSEPATPSAGFLAVYATSGGDLAIKDDAGAVTTLGSGGGGSAITLDIGDDGGDDSTDVSEIATTGDTNGIITEPSADKLLIDFSQQWPAADSADVALTGDSATSFFSSGTVEHERGGLEADVSAFSGLVKITGGATSAVTVTSAGEALLDDADAAAQQATLGLEPGTDVQAWDDDLDDLAGLSPTKGNLVVGNGTDWIALGVGSNGQVVTADSAEASGVKWAAAAGSGSAITFDIGDDGGDDSTDVSEIATSGDTNGIFSEPSADKVLIDLANNWPAADSADVALTGDSATSFFSSGTIEFGRLPTIDDDSMATASATNIASAESVKAYVDAEVASVSAGGLPVTDSTSIAEGSVDGTKEVRFEVDGLTTSTVRVITMADQDVSLVPGATYAGIGSGNAFTGANDFSGGTLELPQASGITLSNAGEIGLHQMGGVYSTNGTPVMELNFSNEVALAVFDRAASPSEGDVFMWGTAGSIPGWTTPSASTLGLGALADEDSINGSFIATDAITSAKIEDGTIVAADIADATITGAKLASSYQLADGELSALAGLTSAANKIPYFTGSPSADVLDFIDDDTMATASATSVASAESVKAYVDANAGGGGGGWELVETLTASSSASLDFETGVTSGYAQYKFVIEDILPAADVRTLELLVSDDGGTTYEEGATAYEWARHGRASGVTVDGQSTGDTEVELTAFVGADTGEDGVTGEVKIVRPTNATKTKMTWSLSYFNNSGTITSLTGAAAHTNGVATDAFRFQFSSGNIASGKIHLYRLAD